MRSQCGNCRPIVQCRSSSRHCVSKEMLPVSATEKASGAGVSTERKAAAIGKSSAELDTVSDMVLLSRVSELYTVSTMIVSSMSSALGVVSKTRLERPLSDRAPRGL